MKRIVSVTAGVVALTLLSGCVVVVDGDKRVTNKRTPIEQIEADNRAAIAKLSIGESPSSVLSAMGTPDFDERLSKGDTDYRILYYRTQRVKADGMTTKDECTPLVFANGELLGWGQSKLALIEQE